MLKGLLDKDIVAPVAAAAALLVATLALARKNNRQQENGGKVASSSDKKKEQLEVDIEDDEYFNSIDATKHNPIHMGHYPRISLQDLQNPNLAIADEFSANLRKYGFVVVQLTPGNEEQRVIFDMFDTLVDFMRQDYFDVRRKASARVGEGQINVGYFQMPSNGFETFQMKVISDKYFNWPTSPPDFKERAMNYFMLMHHISRQLFKLMGMHLKLEDVDLFGKMLDEFPLEDNTEGEVVYSASTVRMFRYYNNTEETKYDLTHIDIAFGAIVPGADVEGLQIYMRGAQQQQQQGWLQVEKYIKKGDLVFFPGGIMQTMTNNYFPGTIHRVVRFPKSERFSIPVAIAPRNDATIDVVSSPLIKPGKGDSAYRNQFPILVKTFVESEYRKRTIRRMLSTVEVKVTDDNKNTDIGTQNNGNNNSSSSSSSNNNKPQDAENPSYV